MSTVKSVDSQSTNPHTVDAQGNFDTMALLRATVSGQDPEEAAYGRTGVITGDAAAEFDEETSNSPLDDLMAGAEADAYDDTGEEAAALDEDAASSESEQDDADSEPSLLDKLDSDKAEEPALDIETVTLKMRDEKGRPQKLEINYSDRDLIKRKFIEAAGMRKFQAERDTVKKEMADIQTRYEELNSVYSKLDEAFQKDGVKGVVSLLGEGNDPWAEAVDAELQHREYLANLTPQEKYRLEVDERTKKYEAQLASERAKREEFERKMAEREEQAAMQSLESQLHPAFDRYRFTGKLGDPVVEHQFDEAVWNKVMTRLSEVPDDVELTQAMIDKEFRTVANNFRKMLSQQSEKVVKSTIEKKKADASKRAQVAAKKGLSSNADNRKFAEDMRSGNIKDAFAAMFSGKVKL